EAARLRIEVVRNLHQHAERLARTRQPRERGELAPRYVRHRAVHAAETAKRTEIGDAVPVRVDRAPAQLGRRRRKRIGECRRRRAQPAESETGGQEIVRAPMPGFAYRA